MLFGVFVDVDIAAAPLSVLLVSLVCRVLFDVALLTLLLRILHALSAMLRLVASYFFRIACSLRAPVLRRDGWNLAGHAVSPVENDECARPDNVPRDFAGCRASRAQASQDLL